MALQIIDTALFSIHWVTWFALENEACTLAKKMVLILCSKHHTLDREYFQGNKVFMKPIIVID